MRAISFFAFIAALASVPAEAQSIIRSDYTLQAGGPNARAAQRPLGPNAQIAQRVTGPNTALVRTDKPGGHVHYPSCSAAGAVRPTPVRRGEPGYGRHLDRDGDGVGCE